MLFDGARFRALRLASGLSIRALAAAANLAPNTVHSAERGVRQPRTRVARALAKALGVPLRDLQCPITEDASLADIRRALDLTQKEMAARIGVSWQTVCRVERGGHVQLALDWAVGYALTLPQWRRAHQVSRDLVRREAAAETPRRTTSPRGERT
ncbi:helix-turn-helix transcriptional regulator [Streptomyces sp. NBC_00212]|uniref:helix-turn-helix transcriptional regulator n=1 Tax=Streptomyces sp. NBC_00212 TaxID=2975684 RepID=UPI002F913632